MRCPRCGYDFYDDDLYHGIPPDHPDPWRHHHGHVYCPHCRGYHALKYLQWWYLCLVVVFLAALYVLLAPVCTMLREVVLEALSSPPPERFVGPETFRLIIWGVVSALFLGICIRFVRRRI